METSGNRIRDHSYRIVLTLILRSVDQNTRAVGKSVRCKSHSGRNIDVDQILAVSKSTAANRSAHIRDNNGLAS